MAAGRGLQSLLSRRRRADHEEEDEDGPVVAGDSQSEGSVLSEPEDYEGEGSSLDDGAADGPGNAPVQKVRTRSEGATDLLSKKPQKSRKRNSKASGEGVSEVPRPDTTFTAMADTNAMMHGLGISEELRAQETVDFNETTDPAITTAVAPISSNGHLPTTAAERQRREHMEYIKKRDADPAFIPNRGNFFMHDTRGQENGQPVRGRSAWLGRGRGDRGGASVGGPFSPANQMAMAERTAQGAWKHDLHDTINEEPSNPSLAMRPPEKPQAMANVSTQHQTRQALPPNQNPSAALSFSKTTLIGTIQVRVSLLGMKTPAIFSEVPWKQYTRLPDHRPPLRRDRPVRVFLPGKQPRQAFPSTERSFVFIPRQNRPTQQGYGRAQYQRSIGGYGYSSRRTSAYGGSMYSGSAAPSRRSSFIGVPRENAFSPVGSFTGMPSSRPIVRLPHGNGPFSAASTPVGPLSGHQTPTGMAQIHAYAPPQQPAKFGTPASTVHHPRPEKAISVTGIESPMLQQESQPFRDQLPAHMSMHEQPPPPFFPVQHGHPPPHQLHAATPLSGIPEQAVHAPAFQPPGFAPPQQYYSQYPPPPAAMYYPPSQPGLPPGYPQMPMYAIAGQHPGMNAPLPVQYNHHPHPPISHPVPSPHMFPQPSEDQLPPPPQQQQEQHQAPSGMLAQERNGMVYYVPASEAQQSERYQPAESLVPSYAMPGLPPPTPAPEGSLGYLYPPGEEGGVGGFYGSSAG